MNRRRAIALTGAAAGIAAIDDKRALQHLDRAKLPRPAGARGEPNSLTGRGCRGVPDLDLHAAQRLAYATEPEVPAVRTLLRPARRTAAAPAIGPRSNLRQAARWRLLRDPLEKSRNSDSSWGCPPCSGKSNSLAGIGAPALRTVPVRAPGPHH
jgi:hypothetical protein